MPFSVHDNVDHPISLYAATKKASELMAHTYTHLLSRLPTTGLRFFTVYGPWGRPDMAYFSFTKAIEAGQPIDLYNEGGMQRDFTYIDDIVEGIVRVAHRPAQPDPTWNGDDPDPGTSKAPYRSITLEPPNPAGTSLFCRGAGEMPRQASHKTSLADAGGRCAGDCADVSGAGAGRRVHAVDID